MVKDAKRADTGPYTVVLKNASGSADATVKVTVLGEFQCLQVVLLLFKLLKSAGTVAPVSGATVWNDLPPHVTSAPSLATFRQRLKSFLFSQSYSDIHT